MSIFYSILVPVYNVEQYVAECIESVLEQSYTNFELILVDDGSTDSSGSICDQFALYNCKIRVYHKPNQGLISTRRYAINKAKGDYYVFLDSDDKLKKYALEHITNKIDQYQCDCLIYGYEKIKDGEVVEQTKDEEEICLYDKKQIYKKCFFSTEMNSLCRKTVKAGIFKNIDYRPYYNIQLSEDLLQSLEIYRECRSIAFTNEKLYLYRINPLSITQRKDSIKIDYTIRKQVLKFLIEENTFSKEDYNNYRDFCISIVINEIIKISLYSEKKYQIRLFNAIRKDDYYTQFLSLGITNRKKIGYKSLLFDLFMDRRDRILLFIIQTTYPIKKMIKRLFAPIFPVKKLFSADNA